MSLTSGGETLEEVEDVEGERLDALNDEGIFIEEENVPIEEKFPLNMSEHLLQNDIHWMSHQKVSAK